MGLSSADLELARRKRRLRLEMARLRRRVDRRTRSAGTRGRELLHWRTYARRYPGNVLLGAFGLGLALSAGLRGRGLSRWLGLRLVRRGLRETERRLGRELARIWAKPPPTADHADTAGTSTSHDA